MKRVCLLTCTHGRHSLLERVVRCFLEQDHLNKVLLIFQNSEVEQQLDESLKDKNIILINQHIDSLTGLPYTSLGAIYNDAIKTIPGDVDIVNMADDDDLYLPNHISEAVRAFESREDLLLYKPKYSYFKHGGGIRKETNIFESSIFVSAKLLSGVGCNLDSLTLHHKWIEAAKDKMLDDENGISTLIYDWSGTIPCFKISGNPNEPDNFNNHKTSPKDHGDRIISACDLSDVERVFEEVRKII